ncbi:MAG TPA: hypothetical protein VFU07_04865 [Candidatus Lumbricidophila sp.]|nr:hypothetical protein [Candidatus Lumbricidophila sp.]
MTAATALLPIIVRVVAHVRPSWALRPAADWLPIVAAALFFVAWFIPDVHISPETNTFQQHVVGGGLYCAALFVYAKRLLGRRIGLMLSVILLFAWVSAFGVANELLGFALTKLHIAFVNTADTDWDLTANTAGALVGYLVLWLCRVDRTGTGQDTDAQSGSRSLDLDRSALP